MDEYNHLVKEAERAKKGSKHPIRNFKKPEFMTDAPHRK
jgi:hypothetical protein